MVYANGKYDQKTDMGVYSVEVGRVHLVMQKANGEKRKTRTLQAMSNLQRTERYTVWIGIY